ncbi:MAG: DUF1254 domain-containing protein [Chloroflexota bacterium]
MRSRLGFALLVSLSLLSTGACGPGASSAAPASAVPSPDATSPAYGMAYAIGLEAYTYGLPLLITDATFQTMTSVNVSQGAFGPVNQFNDVRAPNSATSTAVVAPGATSLSSIAWLDLSAEPLVLHVPAVTDHDYVLALLNPYTENLRNFSTASDTTPGDYVIAGPGQQAAAIPAGTTRVEVDATRIWVIGSTQLKGADDVAAVNAIQDGYTLTPLSRYGTAYVPPAPTDPVTKVTNATVPTGVAYFDALGALLAKFPPPAADAPELAKFATVGIGPGRAPSSDASLSADTLRGLADAAAAGPGAVTADVQAVYKAGFAKHAGYLLGGFGSYGTDYTTRAVIATVGLGAFLPQQAIYAMAWSDATGKPLDGSTAYGLHLATAPPSREGWSLTVYNLSGGLEANPLNRYAFTDTSTLARNGDGSIDITLSAAQPASATGQQNWLPITSGQGFEVIWRLFAPDPDAINGVLDGSGWQPPAITPIQP